MRSGNDRPAPAGQAPVRLNAAFSALAGSRPAGPEEGLKLAGRQIGDQIPVAVAVDRRHIRDRNQHLHVAGPFQLDD